MGSKTNARKREAKAAVAGNGTAVSEPEPLKVSDQAKAMEHVDGAAPSVMQRYGSIVKLIKEPKPEERVATQVRGILACLRENGGQLTQTELAKALPNFITTRQEHNRIYTFYRKMMIQKGFIKVEG